MATTRPATRIASSLEAVRRLREFLATQGYLGEIASKLLFVVSIEKKRSNGEEYYEIVARLPEMGRMAE